MNEVILCGRATADGRMVKEGDTVRAFFTLAVPRNIPKDVIEKTQKEGREIQTADFLHLITFQPKRAEFIAQNVKQGNKYLVKATAHSSSYKDKDGKNVYAVDFLISSIEFAGEKKSSGTAESKPDSAKTDDGFVKAGDVPFIENKTEEKASTDAFLDLDDQEEDAPLE